MKRTIRLVTCLCVASAFLATAVASDAAFDKNTLKCRKTLAKSVSKIADEMAKLLSKCHRSQAKGKDLSLDCNDLDSLDDVTKRTLIKRTVRLMAKVHPSSSRSKCEGVDPSVARYDTCPAPCAEEIPDVPTFPDVAGCMICLAEAAVEGMSADFQDAPSQPLEDKEDSNCHRTIGKGYGKVLRAAQKSVIKCQIAAEKKEGAMTVDDCVVESIVGGIKQSRRAQIKTERKIEKACAAADPASLGGCTVGFPGSCVGAETMDRGATLAGRYFDLSGSDATARPFH